MNDADGRAHLAEVGFYREVRVSSFECMLMRRGQWATFAMMELDLINAQIAQLMAVQRDPANFYQNPFSLYRHLTSA